MRHRALDVAGDLLPALRAAFGSSVELDRVEGVRAAFRLPDSAPDQPLELRILCSTGPESRSLFLAELGILRKLQHPNVVGAVSEGTLAGRPYFVVRRPHRSLFDHLWECRRLPPADIIAILSDIAAALEHCHRKGVVHAEVDPRHIAVGREHSALDGFTMAAAFQTFGYRSDDRVLGNPAYFSPELFKGRVLDGRSDIYSLGVTAYECLVGDLPFHGLRSSDVIRAHLEQEPPTPRLTSAREKRLYRIIKKMLAKAPSARYSSAEAVLTALHGLRE